MVTAKDRNWRVGWATRNMKCAAVLLGKSPGAEDEWTFTVDFSTIIHSRAKTRTHTHTHTHRIMFDIFFYPAVLGRPVHLGSRGTVRQPKLLHCNLRGGYGWREITFSFILTFLFVCAFCSCFCRVTACAFVCFLLFVVFAFVVLFF